MTTYKIFLSKNVTMMKIEYLILYRRDYNTWRTRNIGLTLCQVEPRMSIITVKPNFFTSSLKKSIRGIVNRPCGKQRRLINSCIVVAWVSLNRHAFFINRLQLKTEQAVKTNAKWREKSEWKVKNSSQTHSFVQYSNKSYGKWIFKSCLV